MKHCFLPVAAVVVTVLAALLVAGTVSAAPLDQSGSDITSTGAVISVGCSDDPIWPVSAYDDDLDTTSSCPTTNEVTWHGQDFGSPRDIALIRVYRGTGPYQHPFSAYVEYSDDGTTWSSPVLTIVVYVGDTDWHEYAVDAGSHQYWRFRSSGAGSAPHSQAMEIEMIERDAATPTPEATGTPVATTESVTVYVDYPTPVPQYFDPTANDGDGPEPWLVRFYVGVFATFAFTYVLFRLVDTHQFYLLFMALCMAAAWVTKSVNGAAVVYLFMLVMVLVLKLWGSLQSLLRFGK